MNAAAFLARAESVGVDALRALTSGAGEVAAVFRRSLYIRCGPAWACIGSPEIGDGPLNILTDLRCDWSTLVAPGAAVRVSRGCLYLGPFPLTFGGARIWNPPPVPRWTAAAAASGLEQIECLLDLYPPPAEGLGCFARRDVFPFSLEARAAAAPVAELIRWIADSGGRGPDVVPLLGLGPGLTPSGDDFLAGALAALHAIGLPERRNRLWRAVASALPEATGAISRAHLECAAEGRLAARQHLILNAILGGDRGALTIALAELEGDSHTSPWDGLAGMVAVLRAVLALEIEPVERGSCKEAGQLHTTR